MRMYLVIIENGISSGLDDMIVPSIQNPALMKALVRNPP